MNKTSLPKNQTVGRIHIILILFTLIGLTPVQIVKADVAPPPDPKLGGVVPYQPLKTNVQMMSETVFIDILPPPPVDAKKPKQVKVNASFTMRNQSQMEEQMQVIFPLGNLESPYADPSDYCMDSSSFVAKVNGKRVITTTISTPAEVSAFMDKENDFAGYFQIGWAAFDVTFPVQQDVLLEVQYDMLYNDYAAPYQVMGFDGIHYILETGAGWYGNILSADIILRFPYPASEEVVSNANSGYLFSGNEMHWQFKDFEPTRNDNLEVRLFRVDAWQNILGLRAQVEQNSKDVDAWAKLGYTYMDYGVLRGDGFIAIKPHFVALAVEARQKVVDLRPDSGVAHYNLAESLWFNIPAVQKINGNTMTNLRLDDPAVQQVLHELEQAWTFGLAQDVGGYDYSNNYFINEIRYRFPELQLKRDVIVTITVAPSTQTLAPTTTNTAIPIASQALVPTDSPNPISIETPSVAPRGAIIIILGSAVALGLGILAYRLKTKDMK